MTTRIPPVTSLTLSPRTALRQGYDETRNKLLKVLFETRNPDQEAFSSQEDDSSREEEWDVTATLNSRETQEYINFFKEYAPIRASDQQSSIF
jgi:hypothetical protein